MPALLQLKHDLHLSNAEQEAGGLAPALGLGAQLPALPLVRLFLFLIPSHHWLSPDPAGKGLYFGGLRGHRSARRVQVLTRFLQTLELHHGLEKLASLVGR